jgi:hypothetical protein
MGLAQTGRAADAFGRLEDAWNALHDYSVTIDAHEVLGDRSDDAELIYSFRKPDRARLDVITGTKAGSTIVWDGGPRVTAYKRSFSLFKMHSDAWDPSLTSLRGNGILSPDMGDLVECFGAHRSELREGPGPVIDGEATDALALPYKDVVCPDDPPNDRGVVTLDEIDISRTTGLILMRTRFAGDEIVERWELKDYKVDTGLSDAALR